MRKLLRNKIVVFSLLLVCAFGFTVRAEEVALAAVQAQAEQGVVEAQVTLGLLYANGQQLERDFTEAKRWWDKAAVQGSAEAKFNLGYMYAVGAGVEKDKLIAKDWWDKAAEQNNIAALFNLGMLYVEGEAVKGSYVEAGEYFTRAAKLGNVQSQFNVAVLHAQGLGYPQSNANGYAWAKLAADQGHPDALELVEGLAGQMDEEQLALAKMQHADLLGKIVK